MESDSPKKDQDIAMENITSIDPEMQTIHGDFECAICYSYLKDPTLTRCGHRFCCRCISTWLTSKSFCPVDNASLTIEDTFPDNYTKRTMGNISVVCENDGCSASIPITKFEEHSEICTYRMDKYLVDSELRECSYKNVGCDFKTSVPHEMRTHLKIDVSKHLQLLLKESQRLDSIFKICRSQCLHSEGCSETDDGGECFKGKLPFYLNDVYEKLTELDQRFKANSIRLDLVSSHLEKCMCDLNCLKSSQRETSNGIFVWEICNVDRIKNQIQTDPNFSVYSSPFSSSDRGYRFQLRLTPSSKNSDGLKLLIHVVKGVYDPILKWPFFGKIIFRVINQVDRTEKLEAIIDRKSSIAFQRARTDINLIGYGLPVTMTLSDLEKRGFINCDKLIIVVTVKSYYDNDFIVDLKSDDDDQLGFKRNTVFNNSI